MSKHGEIKITDEVVSSIAGAATLRVEGVHSMSGSVVENIGEMLGKKNFSKGVNIELEDNEAKVDINIIVLNGFNLNDIALKIQENVKNDIQNLVGINVKSVNVHIDSVNFNDSSENKQVDKE